MGNQKNNFNQRHKNLLNQAFDLANTNIGSTGTNPTVGCIIEKDGSVISSGCTSIKGRPHAEFNALSNGKNYKNSNLYVTLEPCTHFGLTPPCVNLIIKKKIKKVYYSYADNDTRSKNKCIKILRKHNIQVNNLLLKKKGTDFYKSYKMQHENNIPFIDAKIAISKDYYTKNKKEKRITNLYSEKITHLLRSQYDCIVSTSKTINDDNSLLTCRINGLENKSPDLIIIDRFLKLKKNLDIFKLTNKRKIIIFTTEEKKNKITFFKKKGIKIITLNSLSNKNDYYEMFKIIKKISYNRVFFECGIRLLDFLIEKKFLHNIYIFKSNRNLKSNGINYGNINCIKKISLKNRIIVNLFDNSLFKEKLK